MITQPQVKKGSGKKLAQSVACHLTDDKLTKALLKMVPDNSCVFSGFKLGRQSHLEKKIIQTRSFDETFRLRTRLK